MFVRNWNWRISVLVKAQKTMPATPGTNAQAIATFSDKRIHKTVMYVLSLRCATYLARNSHKESLTD